MSRQQRVSHTMQKEISLILHDDLKDPRLGLVTITRVDLSPDMRQAAVYFSVLGQDEEYKKTRAALDSALGFIRHLLAERINLRYAPEITFKEDRANEYSIRVQQILEEIKILPSPAAEDKPLSEKKLRAKKTKKERPDDDKKSP